MNGNVEALPQFLHFAIVVLVIIGATILSVQGTIDAQTVALVYGAAIGYAGGQAGSAAGARDTRKAVNGALSSELHSIREEATKVGQAGGS